MLCKLCKSVCARLRMSFLCPSVASDLYLVSDCWKSLVIGAILPLFCWFSTDDVLESSFLLAKRNRYVSSTQHSLFWTWEGSLRLFTQWCPTSGSHFTASRSGFTSIPIHGNTALRRRVKRKCFLPCIFSTISLRSQRTSKGSILNSGTSFCVALRRAGFNMFSSDDKNKGKRAHSLFTVVHQSRHPVSTLETLILCVIHIDWTQVQRKYKFSFSYLTNLSLSGVRSTIFLFQTDLRCHLVGIVSLPCLLMIQPIGRLIPAVFS